MTRRVAGRRATFALATAALVVVAAAFAGAGSVAPDTERTMQQTDEHAARRPNRLIHEKSPYLLQHAYNPVDWHAWGDEAFAAARGAEKPIFLSIGYSTCYWCHVMEKESFENPRVAALINRDFIPIKVDREERPDVDAVYMSAVQAMTGSGGWPMTVFLTPDGRPFWGGTYFPADDRPGHAGLTTVLATIAEAWRTRRADVLRSSDSLTAAVRERSEASGSDGALTSAALDTAVAQMTSLYDPHYAGFGPAPKFPRSHALSFLLRAWYRARDPRLLEMVEETLAAMDRGGIHDQLGGGFHRYSVDQRWLVPHFEKMLYDQALLARTYLEAFQVTGRARNAEVARDVLDYVLRDLRDPAGGLYSAEDAGEPGKEGEYYVWTAAEVDAVLGKDAPLARAAYGVTPEGNFEHRATVLHAARSLDALAAESKLAPAEVARRLAAARERLLSAREKRERPHRDDKILTDWNGLMIGTLAYAGRVLHEPRYTRAAEQAAEFVLGRLSADGRLLHRYRDGEARVDAFLDDYAFLSAGLLDLYEATFEPRWLEEAQRLGREMVRLFWDEAGGGFFTSGERNERLIARGKELYDGATPSGNAVAALVCVKLGLLTMDPAFQRAADRTFRAFGAQVAAAPYGYTQLLIALDVWLGPAQEVVVAGPAGGDRERMLRAVHERFLPRAVLALSASGPSAERLSDLLPFVREQHAVSGKPTAYLCQNYVCDLPTTDVARLSAMLDAVR